MDSEQRWTRDNPHDHPLRARRLVQEALYEREADAYHPLDDIYLVWFCYILGGWKALVGYEHDKFYYEVTHDVVKGQTYVDTYVKQSQSVYQTDQ